MNAIVIHEKCLKYDESIVIGICSSVESAEKFIEEYYGKENIKELRCHDGDYNIEYIKVLEISNGTLEKEKVQLMLEWFKIDE